MKKGLFLNFVSLLLIALLATSPALAYAKNNKSEKENVKSAKIKVVKSEKDEKEDEDDDNENQSSSGSEKKCFKAYGHLIAFGWLKKNSAPELDLDCFLPFGIAKKIRGYYPSGATTTVDTTAPIISNIKVEAYANYAIVSWNTDERADGTAFWSTISPVNTSSSSTPQTSVITRNRSHRVWLTGLSASTTYYVVVRSKDASGNVATSSQFSFLTKPGTPVSDTASPIIYSVVAVVGTSTANIGWQTNEPATSKVYYGTTTPLNAAASTTKTVQSGTLSNVHLLSVTGLSTSTTYYAIVESKDASANTATSSQFSFTTSSGI